MDVETFVFVFPRISLHMLGSAVAFWLVQRDLNLEYFPGLCVVQVVSFLEIPTSLSLSKAVQLLGQLQTIADVNKGDLNGKKKFWSDAIFVFS